MNPEIEAALALVDAGPVKTKAWLEAGGPVCKYCQPYEDVHQAAARILAAEVRRLQADRAAAFDAAQGALVTMESWAYTMGIDPHNNDNYCRLKDWVKGSK